MVTPSHIREVLKRLSTERGRIVIRQIPLMSVPATVCVMAGILVMVIALVVWALAR